MREKNPSRMVIDVHGVGYEVNIPFSVFENLPPQGENIRIYTYLEMKENKMQFYGFLNPEDRAFFLSLISVSNIGPRSVLRMFARVSPLRLKRAITERDLSELTSVPGIGKKTAQRLILELGESLMEKPAPGKAKESIVEDGIAALVSLGYGRTEAREAINKVIRAGGSEKDLSNLVKEALKYV